jgi:hypothetical protein
LREHATDLLHAELGHIPDGRGQEHIGKRRSRSFANICHALTGPGEHGQANVFRLAGRLVWDQHILLDGLYDIGIAHSVREFDHPMARNFDFLRHYSILPVSGL